LQDFFSGFIDGPWDDAVFAIVRFLNFPPPLRFCNDSSHCVGDAICIENDHSFRIASGATCYLEE